MFEENINNLDAVPYALRKDVGLEKKDRDLLRISHMETANASIKLIQVAPLHETIKKILTLRIGGPIVNKREMTHLAIALRLGLKEDEVRRLEAEGVAILKDYMTKICISDGIGVFNKEGSENKIKNTLIEGQR